MSLNVTVGLVCHRGLEPEKGGRQKNEDNYLVARKREIRFREGDHEEMESQDTHGVLLAVADGMGGHDNGDLASAAAVRAVARLVTAAPSLEPEEELRRFVLRAHTRLQEHSRGRGVHNMGTTLVVAWLIGDRCYWVNVGDSRLYHHRGTTLRLVTKDQTRGEFARRDGRPEPSDATRLAQNFMFGSRGLGHDDGIRIDPGEDSGSFRLQKGDRLLICSDGLSGFVDDYALLEAIREAPEPIAAATWLLERALAEGSDDNITALVARVESVEVRQQVPDEATERYDLFEMVTLTPED